MALQLKTATAAQGRSWVGESMRLFLRKPLAFMMMFSVFLFAALVVSVVPVLGPILQMMALPLLSLGFMVAAQSALLDGPVRPSQFIEPLRTDPQRRRGLLILCVLYGLLAVGILLLANVLSDDAWFRLQDLMAQGAAAQPQVEALMQEPGVMNGIVLATVLGSLMSIPFWHAPALVHWGGQSWGQALFSSTLAVWRNKWAFTAYMLAWLGLVMIVALVSGVLLSLLGAPQLAQVLGIPVALILSATFYISLLFCFNDSFGGTQPGDTEPAAISPPA